MPPGGIPFFTDNNVADSAADALEAAGHKVIKLRDVMNTESADPIVAIACALNDQVLVSHDRDFKNAQKRLGVTRRQFHERLHRVELRCLEPEAAQRLKDAMSVIEAEWQLATPDKPMRVEVHGLNIKIWR